MEAPFPLPPDEEADFIEWPWEIVVSIPANCKVIFWHLLVVSPVTICVDLQEKEKAYFDPFPFYCV